MMYGFDPGFMGITMLLFWIFVIALIAWLVLTLTRTQPGRPPGDDQSALRILEERLARGEIDVEEFRMRRAAVQERR